MYVERALAADVERSPATDKNNSLMGMENPMIRKGTDEDFEEIFNIINDAAAGKPPIGQ